MPGAVNLGGARSDNPMISSKELLELAERCEVATGADTFLDLDISQETGTWKRWPTFQNFSPSSSIRAALAVATTLLGKEESFLWRIFSGGVSRSEAAVITDLGDFESAAATPALALTAASLRARAAQGNDHE